MIRYETARTPSELQQILALQSANLPHVISKEERQKEGFVTVQHSPELLKSMNDHSPHIIAKDRQKVIGYSLTMDKVFGAQIPVLVPMFDQINGLLYKNKALSSIDYIVMGQVCIDKNYRGQGIFEGLYQRMKLEYAHRHPCVITEVDVLNNRSIRAHQKVGFDHLNTYTSPDEKKWVIMIWEWKP